MLLSDATAMNIETEAAIADVGRRIDAVEASLRAELGAVRDELRAEIRAVRDDFRAELRSEIRAVRDDLRTEFRDGLAENRRHSEVLSESLRDEIRILAEGFGTLSAKLDSQQR
jgi:replication fork clamp-binding protein CrfC